MPENKVMITNNSNSSMKLIQYAAAFWQILIFTKEIFSPFRAVSQLPSQKLI